MYKFELFNRTWIDNAAVQININQTEVALREIFQQDS